MSIIASIYITYIEYVCEWTGHWWGCSLLNEHRGPFRLWHSFLSLLWNASGDWTRFQPDTPERIVDLERKVDHLGFENVGESVDG